MDFTRLRLCESLLSGQVLGIVPARLASTRLPRKPLYPIRGRPLIEWVWRRVETMSVLDFVLVATDSEEVAEVCRALPVPVIGKEVGWGMSEASAYRLAEAGVSAIDVAGAGDTSWSQVEMHRARTASQKRIAAAFVDWGIPTAESIINVRSVAPELGLIASGGLRDGIDVAKCVALGATMGGLASPFLKAAAVSTEATIETIQGLGRELRIAMFAAGAGSIAALQKTRLVKA